MGDTIFITLVILSVIAPYTYGQRTSDDDAARHCDVTDDKLNHLAEMLTTLTFKLEQVG